MGLADIHTLWVEGPLGWLERLCLASMRAHGNRVVLWSYGPVDGAPAGVERRDGRAVLPETAIIRHRGTGSLALFANRFRYQLLQREAVTWSDIDMVFLRPLDREAPILLGYEDEASVCNALMRLPRRHPVLTDVARLSLQNAPRPFWWPARDRWRQWRRGLRGRHLRPEDMPWGTFGPRALTESLRRRGLLHLARPKAAFYPLHWRDAALSFAPAEAGVAPLITPETFTVHLWSDSNLAGLRRSPPPPDSWIAAMCRRHGVAPA